MPGRAAPARLTAMTTPAPPPAPTPAPAAGSATVGPFAPSPAAVRVSAALGLLALVLAYGVWLLVVLHQAYRGDGTSGPLVDASLWSMKLSAVVGVVALALPRTVLGHAARVRAVWAQYALAVAGPVLAAVHFG